MGKAFLHPLALALSIVICFCHVKFVFGQIDLLIPEESKSVEMSITDAVFLALRNNRDVKIAYLDRLVQKYDLKIAKDEFIPNLDITGKSSYSDNQSSKAASSGELSIIASEKIPTGGNFSVSRSYNQSREHSETSPIDAIDKTIVNSWSASFNQPLLKGGGVEINTASVRIADNQEQQNILNLKSTLINTITQVILAYRTFLQANEQVKISRASLERANVTLEVNKLLVETGRMAEIDLVQNQADIANQEFSYQQTLNQQDNARLNLIKILDIDKHTQIIPSEKIQIEPVDPETRTCIDAAFSNRTDYLKAKLTLESVRLNLKIAENTCLWDLSLDTRYNRFDTDENTTPGTKNFEWQVGLLLKIPVYGDLNTKRQYLNAKTSLRKAEIDMEKLSDTIDIEVRDAVRNVKSRLLQVQLAQQARTLSEKKLAIEREKLNLGRTTAFQLVTFQNDLNNALNNELNAMIAYLNANTELDKTMGTTLNTWKIEFETERKEVEKEVSD